VVPSGRHQKGWLEGGTIRKAIENGWAVDGIIRKARNIQKACMHCNRSFLRFINTKRYVRVIPRFNKRSGKNKNVFRTSIFATCEKGCAVDGNIQKALKAVENGPSRYN
ncbi:MAG: hypothetical protein ACI8RD_010801, partial [Bacillariaceae sp.]|jgi:hypothetical protein